MITPVTFLENYMNSISKQKKYLSENLVVENLRMYESNQEDIKEFLKKNMEDAVKLSVKLVAEVNEGYTWYDLK